MVSRERFLRLGAAVRRIGDRSAFRLLGRLVAAALVVVLALRLWQLWRQHPVRFATVSGALFVAAVVASVIAVSAYGLVWPYLLRRLGTPAPFSWIGLFFKSQLGKYIPGSVWQYAGRVGLARKRGVTVQRAFVSVAAEVAYSALAAGAASSLLLGYAAAAGVILGLAGLLALANMLRSRLTRFRTREKESTRAALAAAPGATVLYLVVWGLYGTAFWTTGRALFAIPASDLPYYVGVFALGWLAGLVVVFAPGGIGVREAVFVALLSGRLGQADAIVLAATSRIVLSAVDLAAGTAALGMPLLRRQRARPAEAP
jgi:uncharacterized membrane protein YbhN (UPF0104 family)